MRKKVRLHKPKLRRSIKGHGRNPGYRPGDHWLVSDRSGFDIRASEAVKEWDGKIVHISEYDPKHPVYDYKPVPEQIMAKGLVRPDNTGSANTCNRIYDTDIYEFDIYEECY